MNSVFVSYDMISIIKYEILLQIMPKQINREKLNKIILANIAIQK
jgi:hypothetical protein